MAYPSVRSVRPLSLHKQSYFEYFDSTQDGAVRDDELESEAKFDTNLSAVLRLSEPQVLLKEIRPSKAILAIRDLVYSDIYGLLQNLPEGIPQITDIMVGGSTAKGTDLESSDIDIVVMVASSEFVRDERSHQGMLKFIEHQFTQAFAEVGSTISRRRHYLTGIHRDVFFDVLIGGGLHDPTPFFICRDPGERSRLGASLVIHHVHYFSRASAQFKDLVRLAKWWVLEAFKNLSGRTPSSFMLELLMCIAAGSMNPNGSIIEVFLGFLQVILRWKDLAATWEWDQKTWRSFVANRRPLVLDPCNPTNNVARVLSKNGWRILHSVAHDTLHVLLGGGSFRDLTVSKAFMGQNTRDRNKVAHLDNQHEDDFEYLFFSRVQADDYYELLGVDRSASVDEIRRAYYKQAKAYHPDKGGDTEYMKCINKAYEVLSDDCARSDYDMRHLILAQRWDDYHLHDAVLHGLINERRSKYFTKWASTLCGVFRIHPPVPQSGKFRNMRTFEFFLWKDITPQPTFDYVKKVIAKALQVKTSSFRLETSEGVPMAFDSVCLHTYHALTHAGRAPRLVDLRVALTVRQ